MQITLTSKRQATFPMEVCEAMRLMPGDRLELVAGPRSDEWVLRPIRIRHEQLAPLKGKLPRGTRSFNLEVFRKSAKDYAPLRD